MKRGTKKAPPKLSPQETRVLSVLMVMRKRTAHIDFLYRQAKVLSVAEIRKVPHRKMQQHVGVVIARVNRKRRKFVIKPGGKDAPRTYRLTRRR